MLCYVVGKYFRAEIEKHEKSRKGKIWPWEPHLKIFEIEIQGDEI